MERFQQRVRSIDTGDDLGQPVDAATVDVFDTGTLTRPTIYDDDLAIPTVKANPFTTDGEGLFHFYASNGRYDVRLSGGTPTIASAYTLADISLGLGDAGAPGYAFASLPTSGAPSNAGRLARVTDTQRGLWMDTGAVWSARNARVTYVDDFDAVGDNVTNDTVAIQAAMDVVRDAGGVLAFGAGKTYFCSAALIMQLTAVAATRRWVIEGNGATIRFNQLSGVGLTIGADSQANFAENGGLAIHDFRITGPEAGNTTTDVPDSSTVGMLLRYVSHVRLDNVYVFRCHTGIQTGFVFPLESTGGDVSTNFIGLHLQDSSNVQRWGQLHAKECRYGLLIEQSGSFGGGRIDAVTFDGPNLESCTVGCVLDPLSSASNPRIRGVTLNNGFYNGIVNDIIRAGHTFVFATPATRSAARTGQVYRLVINRGTFATTFTATHAALAVAGLVVREVTVAASIPADDAFAIVGTPPSSEVTFLDNGATFTTDYRTDRYNGDGVVSWRLLQSGASDVVTTPGSLRKSIMKAVASLSNSTATTVFTLTIPNAAQSAALRITAVASLGAGGAIGANEATRTITVDIAIARTAGLATVTTVSTVYGAIEADVAGAATIAASLTTVAPAGANSAEQTVSVQLNISRASGAADNHTAMLRADLINANASGVTMA